jgi:FtsX-like permease family protein
LRRNPLFASVAVLTLALGIGANTAIFSLTDAVLFRTLPVGDPRDLVILRQRGPAGDIFPFNSAAATVAAAVARRQREIGIRMALGALPGQVARMAVSEAFGVVAGGLAIGMPAAIAAGMAAHSLLAGVLFELSPTDPLTVSGSAIAILLIASLAAYVPARRASRIDPVAAVRDE